MPFLPCALADRGLCVPLAWSVATEAEALEAKAQVEQLQAALSAARAEAADAQHIAAVQLAATQSGLESARGQLATSRASEVEMKGTIKGLRSEAAAAAWEMQQLQTALGELVGRLAAEAAERERKERELMQQIADCKDEVEQLTAQVGAVEEVIGGGGGAAAPGAGWGATCVFLSPALLPAALQAF